ncbi:hypothetical protein LNI89_11300 [Tenacibaculum dicentrarchi]|nr:hypothetical protein [Tenacibaculum dicentrarchi]MCD8421065.1 hypothetical protein [Tenacibaculum dicentrarchi]
MRKKDIPITILKALKEFVNLKGNKFEIVNPENYLLKIEDKDKESDFHFIVEKFENQNGRFNLLLNFKPKSQNEITAHRTWIETKNLESSFHNWLSLLNEYDNLPSFFDDPILKSFEDEYYSEFEIIEENADREVFNSKQILLLDEHLDYIENRIDDFKNEENKNEIIEIKNDISELRKNLSKKTKTWVIKNLSKVWAKITKEGPVLMKEFLTESKKQLIKESVKGLIESAKLIIEQNPDILG